MVVMSNPGREYCACCILLLMHSCIHAYTELYFSNFPLIQGIYAFQVQPGSMIDYSIPIIAQYAATWTYDVLSCQLRLS